MEIKGRERILAAILGACVVFWLLDLAVFSPLGDAWHRRSERIAVLRKEIADGDVLMRRGDVLLNRWSAMQTNALPSEPTAAERSLFMSFDRWIQDSGVAQGSFRPQLRETDEGYSSLDCRADVTGDMASVLKFLYDLEKDPAGLKLTAVELTSRDDNGTQLALVIEMSGLLLPANNP